MIKRSFFGLIKPKMTLPVTAGEKRTLIESLPLPKKAVLLLDPEKTGEVELTVKSGDTVRTGQKIGVDKDGFYLVSPVTGTVTALGRQAGHLGQVYRSITVEVAEEDQWDEEFSAAAGESGRESILPFLGTLPGAADFRNFLNPGHSYDTVIISAMEQDLMVETSRYVLKHQAKDVKEGIEVLKEIRPAGRYVLVAPPDLLSLTARSGAEGQTVDPVYPNNLPGMIVRKVMGKAVPAGKRFEEAGVGYLNVEAVAALGRVFRDRTPQLDKVITVIRKDKTTQMIKVRMGTPVGEILGPMGIEANHGDRIVFGGPMRGPTVFSEDLPVSADTDAVMVQDKAELLPYVDNHCVNCGECVRICPAKIPVNMLIRLLQSGLFEEAADRYDLFSCIECGLCSFVCIARIPIFQYIMLGKYEYDRMKGAEESNG